MLKLSPLGERTIRMSLFQFALYTCTYTYRVGSKDSALLWLLVKTPGPIAMIVSTCQSRPGNLPSCYDLTLLSSRARSCLSQELFHHLVLASCTRMSGCLYFLLLWLIQTFFLQPVYRLSEEKGCSSSHPAKHSICREHSVFVD